MNRKQEALEVVAEALRQNQSLELVYRADVVYQVKREEILYAASVLKEVASGRSFRDVPGKRGAPAKTPWGAELTYWQLQYHIAGKHHGRGELFQALRKSYPDASISALKDARWRIKRGIDDRRFSLLLRTNNKC